jgi:hypothetical protein
VPPDVPAPPNEPEAAVPLDDASPLDKPALARVDITPLVPALAVPPDEAASLDEPAVAGVDIAPLAPVLVPPPGVSLEPQATSVSAMVSIEPSACSRRR